MPLPPNFLTRMQGLLGEEYPAFLQALERPPSHGLRVNPDKCTPQALEVLGLFDLQPVPWAAEGFFYPDSQRPGRHPLFDAGVYYIQEPSAMAVGALANVQPGERVLDLCAAPGGKTTHLAGRMQGKGALIASEIHSARSTILAQNVERMGITHAAVLHEAPERLPLSHYFDCIVADAPCSGEGMFRKGDIAGEEWTPELPDYCAARQDAILDEAARLLRGGGRLVYSTCTFAPVEDEGTMQRFLQRHRDFELLDAVYHPAFAPGRPDWVENGDQALTKTARLFPHRLDGEGHFMALLRKTGDDAMDYPVYEQTDAVPSEWTDWAQDNLTALPAGVIIRKKDTLWLVPEGFPKLDGLHIRRLGLELGTLRRGRFEPAHALSHALPAGQFRRTAELEEDAACKFLRGETFPLDGEKVWTAVTHRGFVLGWGKCAGGIMKNHIPKGLRWIGR